MTLNAQMIIIVYLARKLGCDDKWYESKQDFLFGKSPQQVVMEGDGQLIIEWLETRLGLKPGAAF